MISPVKQSSCIPLHQMGTTAQLSVIEPLPVGSPSQALTVHGQSIFEYLSAIEVAISFFINSILRNTMRLVPIIELLPVGGPSRAPTVHGQSIFEYLLAIAVAISFFHQLYSQK